MRKDSRFRSLAVLALLGAPMLAACAREAPPPPAPGAIASSEPATLLAALGPLDEFSTLRRILRTTGHEPLLAGRQGYTLIAPRDTAFVQLDPERRAALLAPANRGALTRAVDGLLIPRILRAEELRRLVREGGGSATLVTRAGAIAVSQGEGGVLLVTTPAGATATIGGSELATGNGALYVADRWIAAAP